jgi:alkylhydroperoxidase family enzyme
MLQAFFLKQLDRQEKTLGESIDYMRHILRTAPGVFYRFLGVMPVGKYRKAVPADALHVARLVATREHDCGTCLQIEVNLARQDGVPTEILRAVIERKPESMPEALADVYRFAEQVMAAGCDEGPLRERVRGHYGEEALIELCMGMALSGVFPVLKRGLGYAVSCSKVKIEWER